MTEKNLISMDDLLVDSPILKFPKPGSIVEGTVITIRKNRVLVDLDGVSTGVIAGREAVDSTGTVQTLNPGDDVSAFVLEPENDEGLIVLSLRRASQHRTWQRFVEVHDNKEVVDVKITDANKGGLLVEVDGIKGFLPVSQLAPKHYPRVNGADSAKILQRLQSLIGKTISCRVINVDFDTKKLVLSEKAAFYEQRKQALAKLKIGDVIEGVVSGVVNFGLFVTFNGLEGLVHISEIAWGHVDDPSNFAKLTDKIRVKIIGIDGEKISLSLKKMSDNPWEEISKQLLPGSQVKGKISRINEFGAFVEISDDINGLIHISELNDPRVTNSDDYNLTVGASIHTNIVNVDVNNHRISLSLFKLTEEQLKHAKRSQEAAKAKHNARKAAKTIKVQEEKPKEVVSEKSTSDDNPFGQLKLSKKALDVLKEANIANLKDLLAKTDDELTKIEGLTDATIRKISKLR
ncbi:S1 RNA-binding domain-containing protein [bacterium]|mgnify:CR=1 FL=1|jgi:small subunit ribosomal protein S1|nr:S1 RNA-binding domain-containing protein [bacterium]MBT6293827.1 S1 RNA-binding domain-containing protein [bacterium]